MLLYSTFVNMCKEKTPTILVSKMCPFAFYTTHCTFFSMHKEQIYNRYNRYLGNSKMPTAL